MSNSYQSFDDFNSTERYGDYKTQPPFAFREDPNSKEATLDWLNTNFEACREKAYSRLQTYRRYQALYKGIHWRNFDTRYNNSINTSHTEKKPRMVVNFIREMVLSRVAQMDKVDTKVAFIPNNNEQSDVNNAKACKKLADARAEEINMDKIQNEADLVKFLFGTCFIFGEWDETLGPISPEFEKVKSFYEATGDKVPASIMKRITMHVGDYKAQVLGPDKVFPEMDVTDWDDVNYVDKIGWMTKEEVEKKWPHSKGRLMENKHHLYDYETNEMYVPDNKIMVRTFYHKKTEFLPEGARIIYNDDVILEQGPCPYEHGQLPFVVDNDIDVYGEMWGRSFIADIEQQQRYYNNIESANARNLGHFAPKWVAPKGSCNVKTLNNEITVVEFRGPVAPRVEKPTSITNESLEVQDRLEKRIQKHSKVHDMMRGEVPTGVTANSALRFLDEQQSEILSPDIKKRKRRILSTYKQMLQIMSQYYSASDGRTIKTLGKNNEYLIESFKEAEFSQVYDVRLQNSPALPDSKGGKISTIIDLNQVTQTDPVFSRKDIIQMLDLGLDDSFKDRATIAVDTARTAMEMILNGKEVPPPEAYDDLITQYEYFMLAMQEMGFKLKVGDDVKEALKLRVLALEVLMYERAKKNTVFAQKLMEVDEYPVYFEVKEPISSFVAPAVPPVEEEVVTAGSKTASNLQG